MAILRGLPGQIIRQAGLELQEFVGRETGIFLEIADKMRLVEIACLKGNVLQNRSVSRFQQLKSPVKPQDAQEGRSRNAGVLQEKAAEMPFAQTCLPP